MAGQIVAERRFDLLVGLTREVRVVVVSIWQPLEDGDNFRCEFQILGMGSENVRYGMGVDAVQALSLALGLIANTLYASKEWKQGRLTWLGSRDLGLPHPPK